MSSGLRTFLLIIGAVALLLVVLFPIFLLFVQPPPQGSWLVGVGIVSIIYSSMFMCIGALLFSVLVGVMIWIALILREYSVPALKKVDDTLQTVKGTATFVSESVVSPIIKAAGAAAGTRAMVQTLMRRNPPKLEADKKEKEK